MTEGPKRLVTRAGELALVDEGQGPAILALHGVPGSHRDFSPLARALGGGVRLLRPDLPGFGDSPAGPMEGQDQRVELVRAVLDALGLERVVLLGHSLGGYDALRVAAALPERVSGVVLLASVGLRPHRFFRRAPVRLLGALSRRPVLLRLLHPLLVWGLGRAGFRYARAPDTVRLTCAALEQVDFASARAAAGQVRVPVLQVYCEDDPLIEPEVQEELGRALQARRMRFPRGGHVPQRDHAEEIALALRAILAASDGDQG